jgi:hypothetical protein
MQAAPHELRLPFEGMGVDGAWELRLPKASNPFTFSTLADVLLTLEYTALESSVYRRQVLQEIDRAVSGDRTFSLRHEFADAWYELHNPSRSTTPMVVTFETRAPDFPPNVRDVRVSQIGLYFVRADDDRAEVPVNHLQFTPRGSPGTVGGAAVTIDGIISTRKGNAGSWTAMQGKIPVGAWSLAFPDTPQMRARFRSGALEDVLLAVTYTAETPPWPA